MVDETEWNIPAKANKKSMKWMRCKSNSNHSYDRNDDGAMIVVPFRVGSFIYIGATISQSGDNITHEVKSDGVSYRWTVPSDDAMAPIALTHKVAVFDELNQPATDRWVAVSDESASASASASNKRRRTQPPSAAVVDDVVVDDEYSFESIVEHNNRRWKSHGEHWFTVKWTGGTSSMHLVDELFPALGMNDPIIRAWVARKKGGIRGFSY